MRYTFVSTWLFLNKILAASGSPFLKFNLLENVFVIKYRKWQIFFNFVELLVTFSILFSAWRQFSIARTEESIFAFVLQIIVSSLFMFLIIHAILFNLLTASVQLQVLNSMHRLSLSVNKVLRSSEVDVLHWKKVHSIARVLTAYLFFNYLHLNSQTLPNFRLVTFFGSFLSSFISFQTSIQCLFQVFCATRFAITYQVLRKVLSSNGLNYRFIEVLFELQDTFLMVTSQFAIVILIGTASSLVLQSIFVYGFIFNEGRYDAVLAMIFAMPTVFYTFPAYFYWSLATNEVSNLLIILNR